MLALWWPVVLIVVADVIYQICAKKLSSVAYPLAALGATYLVSALTCVLLFVLLLFIGSCIYTEPMGLIKLAGVALTCLGMFCIVR